jgi:hypothetical protein
MKYNSRGEALIGVAGNAYERVAAAQPAQVLGPTGKVGDRLAGLLIIPASLSPGAVSIQDGDGTAIPIFAGGADSVQTLHSFSVPMFDAISTAGPWKVTTGANVSVLAFGAFT